MLRDGNTRRASCARAGVSEDALARWLKSSAAFAEAVTRAEADAEIDHVSNIRLAGREDWRASLAWLERRRPDDWGKRDRLDIVSIVRTMAAQHGLSEADTAAAIAEAEVYLRELSGARR